MSVDAELYRMQELTKQIGFTRGFWIGFLVGGIISGGALWLLM